MSIQEARDTLGRTGLVTITYIFESNIGPGSKPNPMPCHVIFSDDQFNSGQQRTLLQRPSTTTRSGNKNRVLGASIGDCYIFYLTCE